MVSEHYLKVYYDTCTHLGIEPKVIFVFSACQRKIIPKPNFVEQKNLTSAPISFSEVEDVLSLNSEEAIDAEIVHSLKENDKCEEEIASKKIIKLID